MIVKLGNPRVLSDVIGIISELVSEVKLKFSKQGMSIIAVDPANVAMISFNLPVSAFTQLEVEDESIGINLDSFKAILRRASFSSSLMMKTEDNMLKIEIIDRVKREFAISLIDLEKKERNVPSLEFTAKVELNSVDFLEAIEDCTIVADSCTFETNEAGFSIYAKGPLNSAKLTYSSDEAYIESPAPSKSKYSLEYLQKMMKAAKLSDKVIINFSTSYPLRIDFKTQIMELSFILAQRVETD